MGDVRARAVSLLEENTQTASLNGVRYRFSVPSVEAYPFQWFWDSCFHAIVWAGHDPERAADELRGLLAWQEPSGLIPHVVFWDRRRISPLMWHYLESRGPLHWLPLTGRPFTTAGIQPPVLAQAVEHLAGAGVDGGFVGAALPALERYHRFLADVRDPDRDGLVSIVSQFESGLDFSPAYDEAIGAAAPTPAQLFVRSRATQVANKLAGFDAQRIFRRFRHHQEDVLVNALFGQGLRSLERLATQAGDHALAAWAGAAAARVTNALLERAYDERRGLFFNLSGPDERRSRVKTVHCLMPLVLPDLPAEVSARLVEHLTDPTEFWPRFPVPSVALDEPAFTSDHRIRGFRFIWRGPSSMNTNWLLATALAHHGYGDVARELAARSLELVERSGFNEFYDPLRGRGVGAERFGWATLAAELVALAR